jgi:hypothetical protein
MPFFIVEKHHDSIFISQF